MARCNLGWVRLHAGDGSAAQEHFAASLALAQQIGDQDGMLGPLAGMIARGGVDRRHREASGPLEHCH